VACSLANCLVMGIRQLFFVDLFIERGTGTILAEIKGTESIGDWPGETSLEWLLAGIPR